MCTSDDVRVPQRMAGSDIEKPGTGHGFYPVFTVLNRRSTLLIRLQTNRYATLQGFMLQSAYLCGLQACCTYRFQSDTDAQWHRSAPQV